MASTNPYRERIMKAVRYEMPDRTPICCDGNMLGRIGDPSYTQGDNYLKPEWAMDQIIAGTKKFDPDILPSFEYPAGHNFIMKDGTKYLMPGRDLPKENGTQVVEHNYMDTVDYYEFVLDNGWEAYVNQYLDIHMDARAEEDFGRMLELSEQYAEKCQSADLEQYDMWSSMFIFNGGNYTLSMLRGFGNFLKDVRRIPEKVKAVAKMIDEWEISNYLAMGMQQKVDVVYPNLCRTDNNTMRPDAFEKVIWPQIERYQDFAIECDAALLIHVDGNYTNTVDLFTRLRPRKTILQFDGFTDTKAIADKLTKHEIAIWGDIPPQMLTLGTPEEVYDRCMTLKKLYGPGLVLGAGCSFPPNTKQENLMAMKEASLNMRF